MHYNSISEMVEAAVAVETDETVETALRVTIAVIVETDDSAVTD